MKPIVYFKLVVIEKKLRFTEYETPSVTFRSEFMKSEVPLIG